MTGRLARLGLSVAALAWWTRWPVPELSPSRLTYIPLGNSAADDPGLYWLGPFLPVDPRIWIWCLALAAFALALALQRTWLARIILALSAPFAIATGATYWVPAWTVWMLVARPAWWLAIIVAPFRSVAALPAILLAGRRWWLAAIGVVAVTALAGSHLIWHQLYIGLGWFPNPWGITYSDSSGAAASLAPYASARYEADLRGLFLSHVLSQPGWFVLQLIGKLGQALALAMPWVLLVPVVLTRRPRYALLLGATLLPMLLTVPTPDYAPGFLAACLVTIGDVGAWRQLLRRRGVPALAVERLQALEVPEIARP